jgi:hypothetical protein
MKAHYKTRSGRIVFEVEGEGAKAIFKAVSELQEIFESDESCGACQGQNFQYRVRTVDDNDYFEIHCRDCQANLAIGQTKKGSLFPKRKDADGKPLPNRGWKVWNANNSESPVTEKPAPQPIRRNAGSA